MFSSTTHISPEAGQKDVFIQDMISGLAPFYYKVYQAGAVRESLEPFPHLVLLEIT